ncbi:hypothetical protein SY88_19465 [Clostridiales bacterium PH28_bin88]|nr:hypothetical protein SY88_19465 [Clostridiales bacterium PH28_bin88]
MFWSRYRHILITLVLASAFSGILAFLVSSEWQQIPANRYLTGEVGSANRETGERVVQYYRFQNRYSLCGHTVPVENPGVDLEGLRLEDIRKRYPGEAGWVVDTSPGGEVTITRKVDGLCPEDAGQRHLGVLGEYVAVYVGPVGINGGLDRVTPIKVSDLPKEWQKLIRGGGLGFTSEAELLEALDSFDEYQE